MENPAPWPPLHNESPNWGSSPANICGPAREDGSDYAPWLHVQYGNGSHDCPVALAFSNEVVRRWNSHDALVEALRGVLTALTAEHPEPALYPLAYTEGLARDFTQITTDAQTAQELSGSLLELVEDPDAAYEAANEVAAMCRRLRELLPTIYGLVKADRDAREDAALAQVEVQ